MYGTFQQRNKKRYIITPSRAYTLLSYLTLGQFQFNLGNTAPPSRAIDADIATSNSTKDGGAGATAAFYY